MGDEFERLYAYHSIGFIKCTTRELYIKSEASTLVEEHQCKSTLKLAQSRILFKAKLWKNFIVTVEKRSTWMAQTDYKTTGMI